MAIQLFAYAESKGYDVKLYADTTAVSYNPFEFTVADWKVVYNSRDAYEPGVIGSRMEVIAPITQGTFTQNLEAVLQDGDGTFYMTLSKNMGDLWKGYVTPAVGTIEVVNGQRFITLIAADGFHLLDLPSIGYSYTGRKAFTDQIADMLLRTSLSRVFNGFLVSKDISRVFNSSGDYDSLYLTGHTHTGVYNEGTTFRSWKEVLEGICSAFGLRIYQDHGYLVFQDMTKPASSFNVYTPEGIYQTNIDYQGTQEMTVVTGGTKMYLPPLRVTNLQHLYTNELFEVSNQTYQRTIQWVYDWAAEEYVQQNWVDLGTFFTDGVSHIDYDMSIEVRYTIPGGFMEMVEWDIKLYFFLGDYTTDGGIWTNLSTEYVSIKQNQYVSGDPEPTPGLFTYNINNSHLPTVPGAGELSLGMFIEVTQIAGGDLDAGLAKAKWKLYQHGSTSPYRGYRADNSRRRLGQDVTYTSYFGDLPDYGASDPVDQQIVYMGPFQNGKIWPSIWFETLPDGTVNANSLLQLTVNKIAQRRAVPLEYYELDLHETTAVTHTATWGGVEYFPVNVEYSYDGSRVTYARIVNLPLEADPLRYDSEL